MVKFEEKTLFNKDVYEFKIIDHNFYNSIHSFPNAEEIDEGSGADTDTDTDIPTFKVQMFGVNESGETASIIVENFAPYFYVSVPDNWTVTQKREFLLHIQQKMGNYNKQLLLIDKCLIIKRRKFYGFDAGREYKFLKLVFANMTGFNKVQNYWYAQNDNGKRLISAGYKYGSAYLKIYESNLPPILRMFHETQIAPSGWVQIPIKKTTYRGSKQFTLCDYEFCISYTDIIALPNKDAQVPYKMASFDIEASSSHGRFPLPKKSYKLLAENIYDYFIQLISMSKTERNEITRDVYRAEFTSILLHTFGVQLNIDKYDKIEKVYPKTLSTPITAKVVRDWANKLIAINGNNGRTLLTKKNTIYDIIERFNNTEKAVYENSDDNDDINIECDVFENYNDDEFATIEEEIAFQDNPTFTNDSESALLDLIGSIAEGTSKTRMSIINEIDKLLTGGILPALEGDKVTFIGTTLMRYGEKEPYLQYMAVLNTCDAMPDVTNAVVETFTTERALLLGWTAFIQRENPDIVTGFNIDGFDWEFMFHRADETGCLDEFLLLSRNRGEICTGDVRKSRGVVNGQYCLSETQLKIASGDYIMKYINMIGRMQFDLYFWFRREYNLDSYKLDNIAGNSISDDIKGLIYEQSTNTTTIHTNNMTGLTLGSYIHIKEVGNSADYYNGGEKFIIIAIGQKQFTIRGHPTPDSDKILKWGLAKDDVSVQDIFRLSNGTSADRAIVAKYCVQDCNLVHHIINKHDIITDYVEMSNICTAPISFLVTRGQGIKLFSLVARFCRERNTLIPVVEKHLDEGYEGAIVLPPKCGFYADMPIAVNDFNSLYPSSMISENISHDSKVWTREYDLNGRLIRETGVKDETGKFIYDNLPEYDYVDITYDTYKWERDIKDPKKKAVKRISGTKICRFAQFPNGEKGIIPAVLERLLGARKSTRAVQKKYKNSDPARWQTLEVRQLNYKKCANSIYGICGASTSAFCDKDIAASTTAIGRLNITYAKRIIEEVYNTPGSPAGIMCKSVVANKKWGDPGIISHAEYIYGDTDSIFYTFNMTRLDGTPIKGRDALEITIELAQQVGELASSFLKGPHNWEYEKTLMPFCLLSKKRYVGMLYETNPNECKRKEMGIVLKRRDNAPIVKDVYGGIIDILLKKQDIMSAVDFLKTQLKLIADEKIPMKKLIITKQLRANYALPNQIAHKVLADRIGEREPGNRPKPGDRIDYVYIQNTAKDALQGDKIETPAYINAHPEMNKIDYVHYITNQIMKPVQQVFALVLEDIWRIQGKIAKINTFKRDIEAAVYRARAKAPPVIGKFTKDDRRNWIADKQAEYIETLRNDEVYKLLFESCVRDLTNKKSGNQAITTFFQARPVSSTNTSGISDTKTKSTGAAKNKRVICIK